MPDFVFSPIEELQIRGGPQSEDFPQLIALPGTAVSGGSPARFLGKGLLKMEDKRSAYEGN